METQMLHPDGGSQPSHPPRQPLPPKPDEPKPDEPTPEPEPKPEPEDDEFDAELAKMRAEPAPTADRSPF